MNYIYFPKCRELALLFFLQLVVWTSIIGQSPNVTISNINTQSFPFVRHNVTVDGPSGPILDLTQSQFSVCENGVEQAAFFEVIPPNTTTGGGGGDRRADIVFIQDNSGSMGDEQAAIRQNLANFVGALQGSGIDFALGLVRYGASARGGAPIIEENGNLETDATRFRDVIFARNNTGGGNEPGYQAIFEAASGFNFRPGAQRIFVIITDETPNQSNISSQQATDIAVNNSITVFALTEQGLNSTFTQVTNSTNGAIFNIREPFDFILDAIQVTVSNTYLVRYQSSQPMRNGVERTVDVKVTTPSGNGQASVPYTPGAIPVINLSGATKGLFEQAFDPGTPIEIAAMIMDESEPFVQSATLFYQNEGDATFQQLALTQDAGTNTWRGTIPQGFANTPSVNFYIEATDGVSQVSLPSEEPANNPFQIAILPNVAPAIQHTPIETASTLSDLTVTAQVTDATQFVQSVTLFYRAFGNLAYQDLAMTNTGGDDYAATIPAAALTCAGTEYYIEATDDQGVSSFVGTLDDPLFITGPDSECTGTPPPPPPPPPSGTCNVVVRTGANQILVDNLNFAHNKVVIYDRNFTQIIAEISFRDNFQGNKVFENIPDGEYAVQFQTYTEQWEIRCDSIIYVTVTNQGPTGPDCPILGLNKGDACDDQDASTTNDRVQDDCTCRGTTTPPSNGTCQAMVMANGSSVTVSQLTEPINRVILFDEDYQIVQEFAFSDGVSGEVTFSNLAKGNYRVKVQSYTEGYASQVCDDFFEIQVTDTSGSGNPPTGNPICDNLTVTAGNGSITVSGLVAANEIVDFMNDQYYIIRTCGHECGDVQTIEGLEPGQYFVNVKSYDENWQFICRTILPIEVMAGANGRTRDPDAIIPVNFKLYPNPVLENELMVNLRPLEGNTATLEIMDPYGKSLYQRTIPEVNEFAEIINVADFQNGMYWLKITAPNKPLITKKFMIFRMY
ncbi:MAG: T9SS type A sorting domain-containing protein [Bacteroidota bacterium]